MTWKITHIALKQSHSIFNAMFAFLMTEGTDNLGAQRYNAQWQGICADSLPFKILHLGAAAPNELVSTANGTGRGQCQH